MYSALHRPPQYITAAKRARENRKIAGKKIKNNGATMKIRREPGVQKVPVVFWLEVRSLERRKRRAEIFARLALAWHRTFSGCTMKSFISKIVSPEILTCMSLSPPRQKRQGEKLAGEDVNCRCCLTAGTQPGRPKRLRGRRIGASFGPSRTEFDISCMALYALPYVYRAWRSGQIGKVEKSMALDLRTRGWCPEAHWTWSQTGMPLRAVFEGSAEL
jgi:hypothetical protein